MRLIEGGILEKDELLPQIAKLMEEQFRFSSELVIDSLSDYFEPLRDDLNFYVEYPYVDRVYRDSFYNYFSTKHNHYVRDTIRVAVFWGQIKEDFFRNTAGLELLQDRYLGYFVLRPTLPNLVGRSMISPKALKNKNFCCCLVEEESQINGAKLKVEAFPYASQDTETISCAETTVWAVMEYFGNKYSDYKPVLPSEIHSALKRVIFERQVPTHGLTVEMISFALKEFDFGTRIYSKESFGDELRRVFFYYIESGIPFIVAIHNPYVGHAFTTIGHMNVEPIDIRNAKVTTTLKRANGESIDIIDFADITQSYIAMDDNYPPYQVAHFDSPTEYYDHPGFVACEITSIVVPLYPKVYLEALQAREVVYNLLSSESVGLRTEKEVFFRFFLTSSRSFKNKIASNMSLDQKVRERIIHLHMPKFIWVAELSNRLLSINKKAFGMIVLDATEANRNTTDSLLFIMYENQFINLDEGQYLFQDILLNEFSIYLNNLKGAN